ncbi:glutamine and serine-rich protein 1-like isoform X2 [Hetaerina americana]
MDERKAILTASNKRLNQDQKAPGAKPEKQNRKPGRPRVHNVAPASRSLRNKGSTSEVESESGGTDGNESTVDYGERLCQKGVISEVDECFSDTQETEKARSGDEGGPSVGGDLQSEDSVEESGKMSRDRRKSIGKDVETNKKGVSSGNDNEAGSADNEISVILNGDAKNIDEKVADMSSGVTPAVMEKKKRGRKRKNAPSEDGAPRRKLSSRKAKQKARISYAESGDDEDIPGLDDNSDSDDPVWVPDEKKGSSDEGSNFSWSKYEKLNLKSKKIGSNTPVVNPSRLREKVKESFEEAAAKQNLKESITKDSSGGGVSGGNMKKETSAGEKSEPASKATPTTPAAKSNGLVKGKDSAKDVVATNNPIAKPLPIERSDLFNPSMNVMPFQSGTFIAQKSELEEKEEPPIWRVDGKSLLQKYEPFRSDNGSIWYRNVSTYSGWGPKSNLKYQEVPVKFIKQNKMETIVEIIQAELPIKDDKLREKLMKESEKHAYAYEVFVQTLVSHALDSNFLPEIISEKDEYFLNCVEEMDRVCAEKKNKLMEVCQWSKKLTESLTTWPIMSLSQREPLSKNMCNVCYAHQAINNVKMDGNPYKFTTLEYEPPSEDSFKSKEFTVCGSCTETLTLFHKILHLKYHSYENGVRMVSEKKALDPNKNNTDILHDILADGPRIKKEFQEISLMWAQADMKSRSLKALVEEKKIIPTK